MLFGKLLPREGNFFEMFNGMQTGLSKRRTLSPDWLPITLIWLCAPSTTRKWTTRSELQTV